MNVIMMVGTTSVPKIRPSRSIFITEHIQDNQTSKHRPQLPNFLAWLKILETLEHSQVTPPSRFYTDLKEKSLEITHVLFGLSSFSYRLRPWGLVVTNSTFVCFHTVQFPTSNFTNTIDRQSTEQKLCSQRPVVAGKQLLKS